MTAVEQLVERVRAGDDGAYEILVHRFQDMAVGYAYSILRDFQAAEDASQEAFFEAYRKLDQLREPAAFPGWFRRIVFKQCDRITRGPDVVTFSVDVIEQHRSNLMSQSEEIVQREMQDQILAAIDALPEHERSATMLFYISGYSQIEVAQFLDVPVTTVKKRLHSARNRLREMLVDMVEDSLRRRRPSRNETFATRTIGMLKAARSGDAHTVKQMLEEDPGLISARDTLGNTALIVAVNSGHAEVAELLLSAGVVPDFHESAAIGDLDRVRMYLRSTPSILDSPSAEGFTSLGLAAHFGHTEVVRHLLDEGADANAISTNEMKLTPLHAALFGRRVDAARLLIEGGANVNAKRGGVGMPRCGWTALHYCAAFGFEQLADLLLTFGASPDVQDDEGRTALDIATETNNTTLAQIISSARRKSE